MAVSEPPARLGKPACACLPRGPNNVALQHDLYSAIFTARSYFTALSRGETTGLVISAISLASLFTGCVDCFNYVRVGQTLEDDLPVYQTKLNVLQLRFSRWAQAITELSTAKHPTITDDITPLLENCLKQITRLFQRAQEVAENYTNLPNTSQAHPEPLQNPKLARLYSKLKTVINHQQGTTKAVSRVLHFDATVAQYSTTYSPDNALRAAAELCAQKDLTIQHSKHSLMFHVLLGINYRRAVHDQVRFLVHKLF